LPPLRFICSCSSTLTLRKQTTLMAYDSLLCCIYGPLGASDALPLLRFMQPLLSLALRKKYL